jgi:ATP-binding cassette subfamily B protein
MHGEFGYSEEKELGRPYDVKLLRRMYPFTRPYRSLLIISILLVSLMTLLDLSVPYVTKIAVDRYIVPKINSGDTKRSETGETKIRFYRADLTNARIETVVREYKTYFKTYGTFALIPFEDLKKLDPADLAVLREKDYAGVGLAAGVLLGLILFSFGLNFVQVMLMEYTGQMIMHDLRVHLFSHIQNLSVAFFTRNPVGRLVTRVTNDVQNMHELFTSVIVVLFKDLFLLVGIAVVLLSINWKLALVSFTVLPLVLYASFKFSSLARDAFRVLRIKIAEINTHFSETIGGIEVIQLFRQEKNNYRYFKNLNHENYLAGMRQIRIFAVFMPIIEVLGSVSIAVVIFYGGRGVLTETISLGALVAFIFYMRMFFRPIRDIAEKYNVMQNAMASAERIFLILDKTNKRPAPVSRGTLELESGVTDMGKITELVMEDVSFQYVEGETVLKGISFRVRAGESIALVGPTGSGKTSLVNLILRFYDPSKGRVLINGHDVRNIDISVLRSKMALVMQEPFLFSETIKNNIVQGNLNLSEEMIAHIVKASNCEPLLSRLPDGLDTVLSERGASISSGERQLLSIARAFARNPDLILLDEATSYIDSDTEQKIQTALFNLMKNRTSIIIAHRLSTARIADNIIVINRGQIIETGSHDELLQRKGFYFRLNQLQNGL